MKTSKIILIIFLGTISLASLAIESKIEQVIVYRRGAKISRSAQFTVSPGNQEVVISNLTSSIDANSLQVLLRGNAVLLSASVRTNFLGYQNFPKRTKHLQDSLDLISSKIDWLNNEQEIYLGEEKLIQENQRIVNEKEKITAEDIARLADFYRTRLISIRKEKFQNAKELKELYEIKKRLENQLQEMQYQRGQRMGEVVLNIAAQQSVKIAVDITYLTYHAAWIPVYDLRCEGTESPIDMVYKANVTQTTGYDWSGINLIISTGNPTVNNDRPILNPWFIDFYTPPVVVGYGTQPKRAAEISTSNILLMEEADAAPEKKMEQPPVPYQVMQTANEMAIEYAIKVKQDIPADGKEHIVPIQNIELAASYSYHTVPKLDQHAYLLARIGNYNQYNLLPGQANIFFEGMYIGKTSLNPQSSNDSLIVSMGRDDRIHVERNILKDMTSQKVIGTSKKELKAYEIIVRNNKNQAVNLEILDQVPLSRNKEIEVEVVEIGEATYSPDYGKVMWKTDLNPGETKKIRLIYSVKYPKDRQLSGI
jgi:uncharacterized protein (TIGR02231 family)